MVDLWRTHKTMILWTVGGIITVVWVLADFL
jgi:hypothetical protein